MSNSNVNIKSVVGKVLRHLLEEQTMASAHKKKPLYLRPSSFPYCNLREFLTTIPNHVKGTARHLNLISTATLNIGSTMHEAIQDFVSELSLDGVQSICNWQCVSCRHLHVFCTRPTACTSCSSSKLKHKEFEFTLKEIQGHIDNVLLFSDKADPKQKMLIVLDWKSTKPEYLTEKAKDPGIGYQEQLGTYWLALKKLFPEYTIAGAALVFFDKYNLNKYSINVLEKPIDFDVLRSYRAAYKSLVTATTLEDVRAIAASRLCTLETEKQTYDAHQWCKWRRMCTAHDSDSLDASVKKVYERIKNDLPIGFPPS